MAKASKTSKVTLDKIERAVWYAVLNSITKDVLYQFAKNEIKLDVTYSLEKGKLIRKLILSLSTDNKVKEKLTEFVNNVEDWGRQHIFLFRSEPSDRSSFKDKNLAQIEKYLVDAKVGISANEVKPIFIPASDGYKVFKVVFEPGRRLAISWVNKKVIKTRLKDKDYVSGEIEFHAFGTYIVRGISSLDWDLTTGQMMIRVSQADKNETYDIAKSVALHFMEKVFSLSQFNWLPLNIKRAISNIKDSGEVSIKKYNQLSKSGGMQTLQSRDKKHGIEKDSELIQATKAIRDQFASTYGNFFWFKNKSGDDLPPFFSPLSM